MSPKSSEQYEEIRKERVVLIKETALRLFSVYGYHQTSISLIAKEAQISKGLMYNYFESKEALLKAIFQDLSERMINLLDVNHDNKLSREEIVGCIDTYITILKEENEKWRLFIQVSMQKEVLNILMSEANHKMTLRFQQMIISYFIENGSTNIESDMLLVSSLLKGFAMQYVFAPEIFTESVIEEFKQRLKYIVTNLSKL